MIEFAVPSMQLQELDLAPDEPARGPDDKDDGAAKPPPLSGRIALGGPVAQRLTKSALAGDAELSEYVEAKSAYDFYLVHLCLSFASGHRSPRLASASLLLELNAQEGAPRPIAVSMAPVRAADTVHFERTVKIGPELKFLGAEGSVGEFERTVSRDGQEVFLQGLNLLLPNPGWEFKSTKTTHLAGMFELHLVVRAARGAQARVTCDVSASTSANLTRWYRRVYPDVLHLEKEL